MSEKLTEFLTDLATNEKLKEAFKADRAKTMKDNGVSDEDADLVLNQKYDEIQQKLGADYEIAKNHIIEAFKVKK